MMGNAATAHSFHSIPVRRRRRFSDSTTQDSACEWMPISPSEQVRQTRIAEILALLMELQEELFQLYQQVRGIFIAPPHD
ncbi:MAG: hypothetical protein SFZ03_00040 [Candidatus Melainabacteria bacterium]|nr:hypothetical protein [Candidatus Melainabacteria bacterium]